MARAKKKTRPEPLIGRSPLRKEGVSKVTGQARYIDDCAFPDCWHGTTVRSTIPRGRIKQIHFDPGVPWKEITVVAAKDIPGRNHVALILNDQPFLADGVVNHPEEPILLLAHPDKDTVEKARKLVRIEYEPLPSVLSIEDALAGKTIIWGQDNVFKHYLVQKGDVDAVWEKAAHIIEGEYETGAQEQLYIEPNGVVASFSWNDGVTVWGSMQCPYYIQKGLMPLFNLPPDKVRIVQAETGGGFGGKEEYPTILAGHAALLAWKSGRTVKMIYDRAEDMVATTKRHPSRTRHVTALDADGKILAMDIEFAIDGGAYATLSSVVLSRGTIHAAGPYSIPNVRIFSQAVATNHPPHGAFRGFGAPQSIFALERHLDHIARSLGLSPEELRRRNFLKPGDTTATGQTVKEKIELARLMKKGLALAGYDKKRKAFAKQNLRSPIKKGIGFATFFHGSGFTGSGERYLASIVGAEATKEGKVRVLAASTEIGQGTNTVFSQVAAEALGIPYDQIEVAQPDTSFVPNSGPTVASRTAMVVGKLVESAALGVRQTLQKTGLLEAKYTGDEFADACRAYLQRHGELKVYTQYEAPPGIFWDDDKYQGDAYGAYAWAIYVAEVHVDTRTYETRVDDFVALQEVGRVLHPVLAKGQIEGGVAQGVGFALYEKCVWKDGRMMNGQMTNYIMPTAPDVPGIRVFFEELPYAYGPGGAKGIGELPMDGPAPAIVNAIENALGPRALNRVPLMPEDLWRACQKSEAAHE